MYRLLKQPNGKYCIYDTVVDKFIYINITEADVDKTEQRVQTLWYGSSGKNYQYAQPIEESEDLDFNAEWLDIKNEDFDKLAEKMNDKNGEYEDLTYKYHRKSTIMSDTEKLYCNKCIWFEDRSDGKFVNDGRCGLYGNSLEYTHFGYKKCEKCKNKENDNKKTSKTTAFS